MSKNNFISPFTSVKEIFNNGYKDLTLIVPYPESGRKGRYNVLRMNLNPLNVTVIGRELPLKVARQVAKRYSALDSQPLK